VALPPGSTFSLQLDLRAVEPRQGITALICEQALLYAYRCNRSALNATEPGTWQPQLTSIENFPHRSWRQRMRPVYFVFYNT